MIELEAKDFIKALNPLKEVAINSLFARAVVEGHVSGKVYVDDFNEPTTFYVLHPYGMSLLFGSTTNESFNYAFRDHSLNKNGARNTFEWMQAYPSDWDKTLIGLYGERLVKFSENKDNLKSGVAELNTRVNFIFRPKKYLELKKNLMPINGNIVQSTEKEFHGMEGTVIPSYFWDKPEDFLTKGIGYSHYLKSELTCTAYSAFVLDDMLELGMETIPRFRGKGIAKHTCSHLIDYCIENALEPIWACRLENPGSYFLAKKLGFDDVLQISYYRLSN